MQYQYGESNLSTNKENIIYVIKLGPPVITLPLRVNAIKVNSYKIILQNYPPKNAS